jgi:hypothetical protein
MPLSMKTEPTTPIPAIPPLSSSDLLAELEAEIVRVKAMREDALRRGSMDYARYDFGRESGLRFAIRVQRRHSDNH